MPGMSYIRFIPGYAGNASKPTGIKAARPVYPRLRGERHPQPPDLIVDNGLSPATRGTLLILLRLVFNLRFIPGYAGNAVREPFVLVITAVYPRLRGER